MNSKRNFGLALLPLMLSIGVVVGIFMGRSMFDLNLSPQQEKLLSVLRLIESDYVDKIDVDSLLEENYSQLVSLLDPHSAYITAKDLTSVNEDLEGSFSGVGVSFQILNDTVNIIEIVSGGPSEKVGLLAGDQILKVDTVELTGKNATNENVFKFLRGKKGSKVTLEIKRQSSAKPLNFEITRGEVPVNSVDSKYMLSENTGYIKVSKFSRTTYNEFNKALHELSAEGATDFIIDLRGNSGGYMDQAILMANEFLPFGSLIVYTEGQNPLNQSLAMADGRGEFVNNPLAVLTDEFSASASEIFAGALQDNDRGLVVGRRSFGKGLVQNQTTLPDNSALRLTVGRYYTPSGRSIQKEYKRGDNGKYEHDINDRYAHGEFYSADSIKVDKSKVFKTQGGRTVYGGGGIMPDLFVPEDTTGYTSYYINVLNSGLIQKYAYKISDYYRNLLGNNKTLAHLNQVLPRDNSLLQNFVDFAAKNGVPARWYYINKSKKLILRQLKAVIARDLLGYNAFIQVLNESDNTVNSALDNLTKGVTPFSIQMNKRNKR
ncbi:MAG: S41 family peptidase [Muribaculaceae bacterium]|nr:S41 family peptidase [Muribaculaceae bacterium]